MNWEQMTGDDRARFCSLCNLQVYNIAELTRKQAVALITETEGRLCGRIYRRRDGTVITKDCPVGLRAIRRRVARVAGAVFATVVAMSSAVFGQKPSKDESCKQQVSVSRKNSEPADAPLMGTILDPNGAVVSGAKIKITERSYRKSVQATSNDEGNFQVAKLPAGLYDLVVELPGFKKLEVTKLNVASKETVTLTLILTVNSESVVVGIIGDTSLIDTSKPGGTMIITSEMMKRMIIP